MPGMFNNGFPVGYPQGFYQQPFAQQYQQPQPVQQMQQPIQQQDQRAIHGFDWVLGDEGAKSYIVPAGKTFVLFDASPDSNHFYLKSSDATGKPFPAVKFDYEQHKEEISPATVDLSGYVPVKQFEALKAELDEIKAKPVPETLTADEVREMFDQLMEQRFARAVEPKKKAGEKA